MPPRKKASAGPTPVDAITHADKRANLPTADAQEFATLEVDRPIPLRYPRDPTLDPQLVWRGKDKLDGEDLVADAPAIYIQEKIDPRVIVENLRRTASRCEDEPELTLFDTFDGLPELDLVDFYRHQANWSNRMILGDSLNVMASLAEREALRGKVQMIYVDPPYGIKFGSNWQVSARKRDVKDGKLEDASREVEQIKAFRDTWELGIHSYLTYLRDRLTVARDLLTESGSLFVQIGNENVHLVRSVLDEVFGSDNFCSQISFSKTTGQTDRMLAETSDYILWFAKNRAVAKYRQLYRPRPAIENPQERYVCVETPHAEIIDLTVAQKTGRQELPVGRILKLENLTSQTGGPSSRFPVEFQGQTFYPSARRGWSTSEAGMERLKWASYLVVRGSTLWWKSYRDVFPYRPLRNSWSDVRTNAFAEEKYYVVQTNDRVVERCVLMTTDPGDLVLDPTCGSGTTSYVAEKWGRRWITVDTSRVALALSRQRLMGARFPYYLLSDSIEGRRKESELTGRPLTPTKVNNDVRHGFVYEQVQHVTLKSIANNPDIVDGMSREQVEGAIQRHADYELLYDRPHEDSDKVRVAGPFTVESLSPHRSLSFAGSAVDGTGQLDVDEAAIPSIAAEVSFEETILANLRAAGIQNGRRNERMTFDALEAYPAPHIQALGLREQASDPDIAAGCVNDRSGGK